MNKHETSILFLSSFHCVKKKVIHNVSMCHFRWAFPAVLVSQGSSS